MYQTYAHKKPVAKTEDEPRRRHWKWLLLLPVLLLLFFGWRAIASSRNLAKVKSLQEQMATATPEQAVAHPNWSMGAKISIDSATMMNKGLELIEAHHLFAVPYERIDVVVHPQSLIHSLISLIDGAMLAHLGHPDMRVPIAYALHGPDRVELPVEALDLAAVGELSFEEPDIAAFPCLGLAREAGEAGGMAPCVLNAANEVAVGAFLAGEIAFTGIPALVERVLESVPAPPPAHFADLFECDREARLRAEAELNAVAAAPEAGRR